MDGYNISGAALSDSEDFWTDHYLQFQIIIDISYMGGSDYSTIHVHIFSHRLSVLVMAGKDTK